MKCKTCKTVLENCDGCFGSFSDVEIDDIICKEEKHYCCLECHDYDTVDNEQV